MTRILPPTLPVTNKNQDVPDLGFDDVFSDSEQSQVREIEDDQDAPVIGSWLSPVIDASGNSFNLADSGLEVPDELIWERVNIKKQQVHLSGGIKIPTPMADTRWQ